MPDDGDSAGPTSNPGVRGGFMFGFCGSAVLHVAVLAAIVAGSLSDESQPLPAALEVEIVAASPDPGGAVDGGAPAAAESGDDIAEPAPSETGFAKAEIPSLPVVDAVQPSATSEGAAASPEEPPQASKDAEERLPPNISKATPMTPPQPKPAAGEVPPSKRAESESGRTAAEKAVPVDARDSHEPPTSAAAEAGGIGDGRYGTEQSPQYAIGSAANPLPQYPPAARRRGIEGTVVLRVLVAADGRVLSVEIARSSGSEALDAAARETIGRWRFRPAMRGGEAIAAAASVPVQFSLLDRSMLHGVHQ